MDRYERRRARLRSLIEEAGTQAELASLVDPDFPANYISQLVNGHRPTTDEMAERLEHAMHKPDGWMDQWLPDEGGWAGTQRHPDWHLFDRFQAIPDETIRKTIRDQILAYSRTPRRDRKKASR